MRKMSKQEKSWVFYDWANSVFSLVITTAIFPIHFKTAASEAGISSADSTAFWGYTTSLATLFISILAPILGTIADYKGFKKRFFTFFFALGIIFTSMLAIVPTSQWLLLLGCFMLALIGFAGANIFYDSFLVDVTSPDRMDRISSRGFALGYIGSTIPFIGCIALIMLAQNGTIPLSVGVASQISFAITALWWGLFTIPMLKNIEQRYYIERHPKPVITSFKRLFQTFKNIHQYKTIFWFLLAYFFYIDGVDTIITMSTAYGTDLGIGATDLLIILFVTQIIAGPFALLYGKLSETFTGKKMLYVGITIYIIICLYAYFLETTLDFWILAMLVATSQGGIQALSRSYFAKLVPKESANEFFGFYNIFGKFAAIMGPVLVGITTQLTGKTNAGVLSVAILFIIGGILLVKVPETTTSITPPARKSETL